MMRLDVFLAKNRKDFSRSFYQKLIRCGGVRLSGSVVWKPHMLVTGEEPIEIIAGARDEFLKSQGVLEESAPVIFQDKDFSVLNKPCRIRSESLFKGFFPVHRLDKDTSGVLLVAKNRIAQAALQKLWHDRKVEKKYVALVSGILTPRRGAIEAPIHRSMKNRTRMAVSALRRSRESYTEYKVKAYYFNPRSGEKFSLLAVFPRTGRTHQIRVHFASINHPVAGDKVYGKRDLRGADEPAGLERQFLHAQNLSFIHPKTGKRMDFTAPLPSDLSRALDSLEKINQ